MTSAKTVIDDAIMSLICPKCLADMTAVEHEGVTIDICPGCRGIWLDPGELALLRGAADDLPSAGENIGAGERHLQATSYICPRCQGSFETFEFSPGTDLYIDRCKSCNGIYLDAGELKKIRKLTTRERLLRLETPNDAQHKLREALQAQKARQEEEKQPHITSSGTGSSAGVYFFQLITGLPVEIDARRERFPIVTLLFIVFNVAAFIFQLTAVSDDMAFYQQYAFVPAQLVEGRNILGLFTGMFLHGGWLHLLGNMYFLWIFGDNMEDRLNRGVFVFFYLFCGLAASLIHALMTNSPQIPTLGASGAISGIMGAYLVLYPRRRMYQVLWVLQFKVSVAFYLLFWLGLQILLSSYQTAGVAWYAHIGGFVVGAGGIWLLDKAGMVRPDPEKAVQAA